VVADAVGDAFLVVDSNQRIVVFNEAAGRVFGYPGDEVLGGPLGLLLPDRFQGRHPDQVSQFGSRGVGHRVSASGRSRVAGRRKNGSEFPAEVTLTVLEVGAEVMASAVVRDVTSRVAVERALTESEERFRVAFELSPMAVALIDMDGKCISANLALAEQTGYPADALVGMAMAELVEPDDLSLLVDALNRIVSGEASTARVELRQVRADGTSRVVDLSMSVVTNQEGEPRHLIGQSLDISDRVETQARLEEMLRSKDELITSVSHELRTPLTALVGFSHLLHDQTSTLTTTERQDIIESLVRQSADLANIIEDLVVAARAETDVLEVVHVSVDLSAQASQVLEAWGRYEVDHIAMVGPPVFGVGDPARVRQILRNLVSNALHYGGETVVIRMDGDETTARIGVADNGGPIPPAERERIFLPYQRAHETVGVTPSIGFGLAVSRQLAHLMEGDLAYRRDNDENVFELTLPRATDGKPTPAGETPIRDTRIEGSPYCP
jgi:protein-histidine pros-kinase